MMAGSGRQAVVWRQAMVGGGSGQRRWRATMGKAGTGNGGQRQVVAEDGEWGWGYVFNTGGEWSAVPNGHTGWQQLDMKPV